VRTGRVRCSPACKRYRTPQQVGRICPTHLHHPHSPTPPHPPLANESSPPHPYPIPLYPPCLSPNFEIRPWLPRGPVLLKLLIAAYRFLTFWARPPDLEFRASPPPLPNVTREPQQAQRAHWTLALRPGAWLRPGPWLGLGPGLGPGPCLSPGPG
jgi:hypothetical protein